MPINLKTPIPEQDIRNLRVGDIVAITGKIFTARDAIHHGLATGKFTLPVDWQGGVVYHCGPVVVKEGGNWVVKAAGPTTSIREEPYEHDIIKKFGIRAIIGKGGMGEKTSKACAEYGCAYIHAIGGAAQVLAQRIIRVSNVYFLEEVGAPEAIWEFEVEGFTGVVTMDATGASLHREILHASEEKLAKLIGA